MMMSLERRKPQREDESRPADPEAGSGHPLVVFGDHQFCAGERLDVNRMRAPHMHSQIEINFLIEGTMTYRFDGETISAKAGDLILFWGMVPHQVCEVEEPTRFVCLYVPFSQFLDMPGLDQLRRAILRGGVIAAQNMTDWDRPQFFRWREELLSGDAKLRALVRDELTARMRRLAHEGWRDLRGLGSKREERAPFDAKRAINAESMIRFIGENAARNVSVSDVAEAANLHPNYAMTLFRQFVGLTIHEAIERHRLDIAQSLLIATDKPVATIAFETGFGSLSTFYAAFEKRFKATPRTFRLDMRHETASKRSLDVRASNL
ncbi:MAG: helix-turn-helix domain-containing protein [Alphaproteobacteria bacterium]